MGYQVKKTAPCHLCGKPTNNRLNVLRIPQCLECGIKKATDNMTQIRGHSGPYYERWRDAMMRTFAK